MGRLHSSHGRFATENQGVSDVTGHVCDLHKPVTLTFGRWWCGTTTRVEAKKTFQAYNLVHFVTALFTNHEIDLP